MPYWLWLLLGSVADGIARVTGKTLPVSSIQIRKFCASTTFTSTKQELDGFDPPHTLADGIDRTSQSEFISPDPNCEIFYTE